MQITKAKLREYFTQHPIPTPPVDRLKTTTLTPAAILLPIIDDPHELILLFTERNLQLKNHAGQISFPGGKKEDHDKNLQETALRETEEEIGVKSSAIEIIGELSPITSSTGFWVTPFIGLITPPVQLHIDPNEVASVFTAPLNFVLDIANQQQQPYFHQGIQKKTYVIDYQSHRIWGMTAAILAALSKALA